MPAARPLYRAIDVAVGLVLVIAAVALFLHLSSTDTEFSRYNVQWNGTSEVFGALEGHDTVMVRDPAVLRGRQDETLLMIAPIRAPTAEEGAGYRAFVAAGNTLVLADDFGAGNEVLKAIGASARFEPGNLSSLTRQFETSTAPIGYPLKGQPLVGALSKVVFNRPVAVSGGDPLINTTYFSWIDTDGNGGSIAMSPSAALPLPQKRPSAQGVSSLSVTRASSSTQCSGFPIATTGSSSSA